jgi:methionine aminotransferase
MAARFDSKLPEVGTTIFTSMSRLAEQYDAVNLGQGFPDFEPPESLLASLERHCRAGHNQYAPMAGVLRLRERIAERLERDYGARLDPESELTVTSGATEGIFDVVAAMVRPGDEVVVLDPCYDSYAPAVRLQGGHPVHVPLNPDFSPDYERLRAAIGPRTRLVVVNYPHNPSGAVLSAADLDELTALARDRELWFLSDEVYEHIVFDGHPYQSFLRRPELRERSFVVGSFGKAFHATGWKVGWVAAPPALSAELRKVHQFVTFATFTPAQHAFADVLEQAPEHLRALPDFYQQKRDRFRELLAKTPLRLLPVGGAYFQLADYSAFSREDDLTFAQRLTARARVAAIPVSALSSSAPEQPLIRFCFAKQAQTLELAAARLLAFFGG